MRHGEMGVWLFLVVKFIFLSFSAHVCACVKAKAKEKGTSPQLKGAVLMVSKFACFLSLVYTDDKGNAEPINLSLVFERQEHMLYVKDVSALNGRSRLFKGCFRYVIECCFPLTLSFAYFLSPS